MNDSPGSPPLLRASADGRSEERLRAHYLLEKRLAGELKMSTREERISIYARMYDELFAQVPDHPRLTRREDPVATRLANQRKMALLENYMGPDSVVGEFGAGDCRFAMDIAQVARKVYAIDIADQAGGATRGIENLQQIIYDGFELPIPDESIDVMISDQLLEHLHPDDVGSHLEMIRRVLRPGGVYLIRTPHAFTGPHDISKYFSRVAEGFHLKEWTYRELFRELSRAKYSRSRPLRTYRGRTLWPPTMYFRVTERLVASLPSNLRVPVSHALLKDICLAAYK